MATILYNEKGEREEVDPLEVHTKLMCKYTIKKPEAVNEGKTKSAGGFYNEEIEESARAIYEMYFREAPHSNTKTVNVLKKIKEHMRDNFSVTNENENEHVEESETNENEQKLQQKQQD